MKKLELNEELSCYIRLLWSIFDHFPESNIVDCNDNCIRLDLQKGKYKVSVSIKEDTTIDSLKEDIKNEIWKETKFYLDIYDKLG